MHLDILYHNKSYLFVFQWKYFIYMSDPFISHMFNPYDYMILYGLRCASNCNFILLEIYGNDIFTKTIINN